MSTQSRARLTAVYQAGLEKRQITLVQKPRGIYTVFVSGIAVGRIERLVEQCWSYAQWHIVGDTAREGPMGLQGGKYKTKLRGFTSKYAAAHELAVMQSGMVIQELCTDSVEVGE